jgi:two-component system sensor histidine kinase YesM
MRLLNSLQRKFFLTYAGLILVMCTVFILLYLISAAIIKAKVTELNLKTLQQIGSKIQTDVDKLINFSNMLYSNSDLRAHLNNYNQGTDAFNAHYNYLQIHNFISNQLINTSDFDPEIVFLAPEGKVLYYSWSYKAPDDVLIQAQIAGKNLSGLHYWTSIHERFNPDSSSRYWFSVFWPLTNLYNKKIIGILVASISEQSIYNIYKDFTNRYSKIVILSRDSRIISASVPWKSERDERRSREIKRIWDQDAGYFNARIHGRKYITIYTTIKKVQWKLVQYIPLDYLLHELHTLNFISISVLIILLVISFVLSYYISYRIADPVKQLCATMRKVQQGDLSVRVQDGPDTEVNVLSRTFNKMILRIEDLNQRMIADEKQKHRLELEALQAQINPHFLYNTLNSIKLLARMNRVDYIGATITALIHILKNTTQKDELATLGSELKVIESYVYIMKARYANFEFRSDIPDNLYGLRLLRFILQPFIENAIFHGFEQAGRSGRIVLAARLAEEKECLIITISDDGAGMSLEKTNEILRQQVPGSYTVNRIGIKNVIDRIQLSYGEDYGVAIQSEMGKGTLVTIILPILEEKDDAC